MSKYQVQILVLNPVTNAQPTWKSIHPTNRKPYEYSTKEEARDMARMCYPMLSWDREIRLIKV